MRNQRAVLLAVLVAGGGLWLWKGRRGEAPATSPAVMAAGSGSQARPAPRGKPAPAGVEVTVTGERGPIGGASVRLAPEDGDVLVVKAGADGVARADRLAPGTWRISASAAGHEPAAARPQELAAGAVAKVALALAAGGRRLGGVVTDVSGGPIAGARIDAARLALGRPDRAIATAVTGPDGRYEVAVAEGQLLVAARSLDYAAQARNVEVGPAGATADFALVPGGAIEGVVLDAETRQPVRGATIGARRERAAGQIFGEAGRIGAVAGADGRFRVAGLRPGVYELDADAEGRHARAPTVVGLGVAEQVTDVELLVGAGPVIRGTVVDESNAPVAGAKVAALGRGARDREATTDEKGAFVLEGLSAGRWPLVARGDAILPGPPARVELADLAMDRAIGVINGVVLGPDGKPLADAWVSAQQDLNAMLEGMMGDRGPRGAGGPGVSGAGGPGAGGHGAGGHGGPSSRGRMVTVEATDDGEGGGAASEAPPALTDAQGRFELRGLTRGVYEVVADAQAGKLRGRASGVTPDATLTIRATGLTTLSGTVRGGSGGAAALFTVELEGPTRAQRTFTDGKFELGRVDPGSYVVRVRSSEGSADATVDVAAGAPATVDITLEANAIVIGTIVDGAGKPLPDVPVAVVEQKDPGSLSVSISGPPPTSGPDGRFRLEHKAGPSAVVVLVPPRPISKRGLMLEAGKTLDVGEIRVDAPPPGGPGPGSGPGARPAPLAPMAPLAPRTDAAPRHASAGPLAPPSPAPLAAR